MNKLTSKLLAREFHQHRWLQAGTIAVGMISLVVAGGGTPMLFNIGMLCWLTAIAAFGCVLAMLGIASERKERSLLFVLSLPLSFSEYVRLKLFGLLMCYLVPWLTLTVGAIALVLVKADMPDGLLPFTILLCVFLFANFSFVLCSALAANSEGLMTLVIIVHNVAISLFIFLVGVIPGFFDHLKDPAPIWGPAFWTVLGIEAACLVVICSLPYFVVARRRDVI
jgi:ABC-type transport system involved in multi-copper enzyme maturation permease subunit